MTTLVSAPTGVADPDSGLTQFLGNSADGTHVVFFTPEKLTADDQDTARQDLYERFGGVTSLVSGPTGVADPDVANALPDAVSADGARVFFRPSRS